MFCLKVDWKKRLIVCLISIPIMIAAIVWFLILSGTKGITATLIACIVYALGTRDILFFEIDKSRKLGYYGGKHETEWKPELLPTIMRIAGFGVIIFYLVIELIGKYAK